MELTRTAEECARSLLDRMRETPMRRGGLTRRARQLKIQLSRVIAAQGVPTPLAKRVASQLALKFSRRDLRDEMTWRAVGRLLRRDVLCLQEQVGMSAQRITAALPKLSAAQLIEFLDELTKIDRRIARTILHAAVTTSDPLATGRRYIAEYCLVARKLRAIEPSMARTVAAATFSAGTPLTKAMEHLQRFSSLLKKYQDDPQIARRLARAAFRARPSTKEFAR
jgi:hypothetical protein